jgi:hypothetical protein
MSRHCTKTKRLHTHVWDTLGHFWVLHGQKHFTMVFPISLLNYSCNKSFAIWSRARCELHQNDESASAKKQLYLFRYSQKTWLKKKTLLHTSKKNNNSTMTHDWRCSNGTPEHCYNSIKTNEIASPKKRHFHCRNRRQTYCRWNN